MHKPFVVLRVASLFLLLFVTSLLHAQSPQTFGQAAAQDLGFSGVSVSNDSPIPGSIVVLTVSIVNNGTANSAPFNVTRQIEQLGVGALNLTQQQLDNVLNLQCTACGGIAGRSPVFDAEGNTTGQLTTPVPQTALVIFSTAGLPEGSPEGVYRITLSLDPTTTTQGTSSGAFNDPVGADHTLVVDIPLFTRPEMTPTSLRFLPPSPVTLGAEVEVQASVTNAGLRSVRGTASVNFSYCLQTIGDLPCVPDQTAAFGTTATRALSLSGDFVKSGSIAAASVTAVLDTALLSSRNGLYRIAVRVAAVTDSQGAALQESDPNNNELTALLTVGSVGGADGGRNTRMLLVGKNQIDVTGVSSAQESPIFMSPSANELWALDTVGMKNLVTCADIPLGTRCGETLKQQAGDFLTAIDVNALEATGTVKIDVFNSRFEQFDASNTQQYVINRWTFDAEVTALAENPVEPVIYIGLSDGNLLRLELEKGTLFNRLATLTAADLVTATAISVRADAAITAILPLTNGVVIGTTHNDTQRGQVHFLLDDRTVASTISSTSLSNLGRIHKFDATPGFLYVAADDLLTGAPLFYITRIRASSIDVIFRSTTLQGVSGQFSDFAVNRSSQLFIATSNDSSGTVFSFRLSASQNTATPLFQPWFEFEDPDTSSPQPLRLGVVKRLQLGDVTPNVSGDEVLYIGTNQQTYAVETRRQFLSSGALLWVVNLEGDVTTLTVDTFGQDATGLFLVATSDARFNIVDGRNRSPLDKLPNQTVAIDEAVFARIYSQTLPGDGFFSPDLLISIYGSDGLYFTVEPK